ncbi:hypothetical protein [Streptomyces albidoflavus]|uniref:hypothetical protein n=1 Tax=Streptomyces albidoflavus TaxID=1886 RepID=UPI00352992FB
MLRRARRVLADQLGADPGPGLARLEREVLRQADHPDEAAPATGDAVWSSAAAANEGSVPARAPARRGLRTPRRAPPSSSSSGSRRSAGRSTSGAADRTRGQGGGRPRLGGALRTGESVAASRGGRDVCTRSHPDRAGVRRHLRCPPVR